MINKWHLIIVLTQGHRRGEYIKKQPHEEHITICNLQVLVLMLPT